MKKIAKNVFCVTRQHYWADGRHIVEIAQGGLDYTNADMLVANYSGEGVEYKCMTEAVEAGIAIALQWKKDTPDEVIEIGTGFTGGMGLDFEGEEVTDGDNEALFAKLRQEAKEFDDKLPKCARCGKIREENYGHPETFHLGGDEAYPFCSDFCASEDASDRQRERLKEIKAEGYEAARVNDDEDECPYDEDSDEGEAWRDGWDDFHRDAWAHHMGIQQSRAKVVANILLDANVMFEYRPGTDTTLAIFLVKKEDAGTLQQAITKAWDDGVGPARDYDK